MTIELPDFGQSFDYENYFYLSCRPQRIGKLMAHAELYRMALVRPGALVECGVFKGASFVRWAKFRNLLSVESSQKLIGFDVFGCFPEAARVGDVAFRERFTSDAGKEGISVDQLVKVLGEYGLNENVELIKGDLTLTGPEYVAKNPNLKISMLVVDVDLYEPTRTSLECFYPLVVPGGIVVLDDYAVVPGATEAIDEYFQSDSIRVRKFPFSPTPTYLIKGESSVCD